MSRTFNMVGGGGGKAVLAVAVTNGTATSVTATKSGVSVSMTYSGGIWSAELPSFGTWTVTITDGTHSNSKTVEANTAGIYSVSIYMPDVPSAYTQLEYLGGDYRAYINTGLNVSSGGKIDILFAWPSDATPTNLNAVFSTQISASPWNNILLRYLNGGIRFATYGLPANDIAFIAGQDYEASVSFDSQTKAYSLSINGERSIKTDGTRTLTANPLYLYTSNNAGTPDPESTSNVRIKYFRYYAINSATPTANLIPAKRNSDSVLGMYDVARNTFYTNPGSGAFVAGPAV